MTSQILCISITLNKQFNLYELLLPVHSISYIRISQYILLINNFSILNTDYPVCISCNIRIMGYENNCFSHFMHLLKDLHYLFSRCLVKCSRRFIRKKEFIISRKCSCNCRSCLFSAGYVYRKLFARCAIPTASIFSSIIFCVLSCRRSLKGGAFQYFLPRCNTS